MPVDVGQDPGKAGWIAWVDSETGAPIGDAEQPLVGSGKGDTLDRSGMSRLVRRLKEAHGIRVWVVEKQEPARGPSRNNSSSLGLQLFGYGLWLGILNALEVPTVEIDSRAWRKALNIPKPSYPREEKPGPKATKAEKKEWTKRDRQRQDRQRKEGLERAVQKAASLFPALDLRRTEKCKAPSPDKAVAYMLASLGRNCAAKGDWAPTSDETAKTACRELF